MLVPLPANAGQALRCKCSLAVSRAELAGSHITGTVLAVSVCGMVAEQRDAEHGITLASLGVIGRQGARDSQC